MSTRSATIPRRFVVALSAAAMFASLLFPGAHAFASESDEAGQPRVTATELEEGQSTAGSEVVASAITPQSVPTFTLYGRGNGHGIGLSQYGSKGWADAGKSGSWIATNYFRGSQIGTAPGVSVKVYLDPAIGPGDSAYTRSSWTFRPGHSGGRIVIGGVEKGYATYRAEAVNTSQVRIRNLSASGDPVIAGPADSLNVIETGGSPNLVEIAGGSGLYNVERMRHRGRVYFSASGGKVRAYVKMSMDSYLYGVVPRESPASWPQAALQAQALTARSYAYPKAADGSIMYCTTWDQAYQGHSDYRPDGTIRYWEDSRSNTAVDETAGRYVKYGSDVIRTFFSSSSGGHTANIEDVWLSSTPQPYYRGVEDPHDGYPNWTVRMDGSTMASKLKGSSSPYARSLRFERAASGHARRVTVTWSDGTSTTYSGSTFRSELGLKSTFVATYYFPTTRISGTDRYAVAVSVSNRMYPSGGAGSVIVARGDDAKFADALTASGLAGVTDGPVLLIRPTGLSTGVANEVRRLKSIGATRLYVVGGERSVTPTMKSALESAFGGSATRLGGANRYEVAVSVAREIRARGGSPSAVLIASGDTWPDAAIASSLAAGTGRPVLLVSKSAMPSATLSALSEFSPTNVMVVGGPASISDAVYNRIRPVPSKRFGVDSNRYKVAADVARWAIDNAGYTYPNLYLVTGARYPDSITGGVLAGHNKQPLLMTAPDRLPGDTASFMRTYRAGVERVTIVGGSASVGEGAYKGLCLVLN